MSEIEIGGRAVEMGAIVTVTKHLYRERSGGPRVRRWWVSLDVPPRAGWVIGKRWLLEGERIPGLSPAFGDYGEPPEFRETGKRTPCLLVVYWPNRSPVRVPEDGWRPGGTPTRESVL